MKVARDALEQVGVRGPWLDSEIAELVQQRSSAGGG